MKRRARGLSTSRIALACSLAATGCAAQATERLAPASPRRVQVGVELGYAFPAGVLERESKTSDVVRGLVPLGVEGGYRLSPHVMLLARIQYGFGVPKLCATASDCIASLGHDIALEFGGRFFLPRLGPVSPEVSTLFGYEWFRSELSDNGVTSARDYRGPMLAAVQLFSNLTRSNLSLGPFVTASSGIFAHRALETPAFSTDSYVDRAGIHVWVDLGFRGALSF